MALNSNNSNNIDNITNLVPSPKINKSKDLNIEDQLELGKIEKEIESFGDISGINKENNEELNDNSLIIINKNISNNIFPKIKKRQNLEKKIKIFFENSKINELNSSKKQTLNLNYKCENSKQTLNNNEIINKLNFQNITLNNEKKYNLLFNENKKLDINTLREEYTKMKNDDNLICNQNQNNNKPNKFISNINIDFDKFIITKQNKYNNSYKKFDCRFNNYNKTKNNIKEKESYESNKYQLIKNELFKEKPSSSVFNIKFFNNNHINRNTKNIKKNKIFNSLRNLNESFNSKEDNNSWILNSNNINNNFNNKINIYNSQINLDFKNSKNKSIFSKLNRNNLKTQDFKFVTPKSNFINFKNIKELKQKSKIDLDKRYINKASFFYYNLTAEENKNDNLNYLKKGKFSFGKIFENNDNILDKLSSNFDEIFNFVENKIKNKGININNSNFKELNSSCINKLNYKKLNPKLLSISQNELKNNDLLNLFKDNNKKVNLNLETKVKLNRKISAEKHPLKRIINRDMNYNNFGMSHFSYNDSDHFRTKNKRRIILKKI